MRVIYNNLSFTSDEEIKCDLNVTKTKYIIVKTSPDKIIKKVS